MKFNQMLAAALAVSTLFFSCAKDNSKVGPKGKTGDETYAGVKIVLPSSTLTRADDPNTGIAGEKSIRTVGVYIVDQANGNFDYQILNVTDFTQSTNDNKAVYTANVTVKTTTGNKKIFVVANPTTVLQNKLQVAMGSSLNPLAFGLAESSFLNPADATTLTDMVMSGAYSATGGIYDMTTAKTQAEALAAPAEITIGRNLSKLVVQKASTYKVLDGSTSTLTWSAINRAKDAYFLPQSTGTLYGAVPAEAVSNNAHAYWTNFSGLTGTGYISVLEYGTGDKKDAAYAESKYVFENIPQTCYGGNTTGIRVKGVYKPKQVFGSILSGVPQDISGSFIAGTDFHRSKIDGTYWTTSGRNDAITNSYKNHTASDFVHYVGGVGYYTIWVKDGAGNKGVKRNGYYLVQINEVRGPGSATENPDPTDPVEDDTHLGVVVTVLNWDFEKIIEDIQ